MKFTERLKIAFTGQLPAIESESAQSDESPFGAVTEDELYNTVQHPMLVERAKRINELRLSSRPLLDSRYDEAATSQYPKFWVKYDDFHRFIGISDLMQTIIDARGREITRRGIAIKPVRGGENTGMPVDENKPDSEVHASQLERERLELERFNRSVNANKQKLKALVRQFERDECTYDEMYAVGQFEYDIDVNTGAIRSKKALEFWRAHPANMRLMIDRRARMGRMPNGTKAYFSLHDRSTIILEDAASKSGYRDTHGHELIPAYFAFTTGSNSNGAGTVHYGPWEVYHESEFNPTMTYSSNPPIVSCWMKVWTLVKMDEWIKDNYSLQRPPKFFMVFNTSNPVGLEKEYQKMIQRAQADPHVPQILANEHEGSGEGVQVIDLMRSLEEMQWIDSRQEFRQVVGAVYGVMPVWQGDVSTSGGLNNEGMQITVTNRAVEDAQTFYNEGLLPWIAESIGCYNFTFELVPSEELDESAELQRQAMKMQNAQLALQIGLDVDFDPETGEFTFSGKPELKQMPGVGGMGGGFGSDPSSNVDSGFDAQQDVDGTPQEMMQSDGAIDFPQALAEGESRQADKDEVVDLASAVEKDLFGELAPRIKELQTLAKSDPEAAQKSLSALVRDVDRNFRDRLERELRRMYDKGHAATSDEFSSLAGIVLGDRDEAIMSDLLRNPLMAESILGLRSEVQQKAFSVLTKAVLDDSFNLQKINKELGEVTRLAEGRVKEIARTNTNRFFQAGRRAGYQKAERLLGEEFLYDWVGPSDERETTTCANIKARIQAIGGGAGVPWDVLVQIVQEEQRKEFPTFIVDPRAPTAHWNCRHHALRKVRFG